MSNTEALPPLPDRYTISGFHDVYTADQMRAYASAALAQPAASGEPVQIRADFEQRMIGVGASPTALSRLKSGEYLSPSIQSAWEAEKQKYATAQPAPAREPLTEQQVFDSQEFMHLNGSLLQLAMPQLMLLVRCIERAHGVAAKEAP